MTCPHCAALRERIADLEADIEEMRRDAGMSASEADVGKLTSYHRDSVGYMRPTTARVVAYLYSAKGRPIHYLALLEGIPAKDKARDPLDRTDNIVRIWISRARKCLGKDAIATVHGIGYRLTTEGAARVAAILGG